MVQGSQYNFIFIFYLSLLFYLLLLLLLLFCYFHYIIITTVHYFRTGVLFLVVFVCRYVFGSEHDDFRMAQQNLMKLGICNSRVEYLG